MKKNKTQNDLDKKLTADLFSGYSFIDYIVFVFNWIPDDVLSKEQQDDNIEHFSEIIRNCFNAKILTIDCAKYIADKFHNGKVSDKIKPHFIKDKFVSGKTTFKNKITNKDFIITSNLDSEFLLLRAIDRTRSHRGINNYEIVKVHFSILNNNYILIKY